MIGVVRKEDSGSRVQLLPTSVAPERLLHLIPSDVRPTEVLRFSAPCAEGACSHFDDGSCLLASRIATRLPEGTHSLQPCAIRSTCRWFHQERAAACRRCPQVVTEPFLATPLMEDVARPRKRGGASNE